MIRHIPVETMYSGQPIHWLTTTHHFSFDTYYNKDRLNFGALRVVNDDIIAPRSGFETHPHKDMEIISYVIKGALTHRDSLGSHGIIRRGEVQYMSAGSGITHSEINEGDEPTRLLQIWIVPDTKNVEPAYGEHKFSWNDRENKLLHLVSCKNGSAPVKLNQDVNIYAIELDTGTAFNFTVAENRQCYVVQVEGASEINGLSLKEKDALETVGKSLEISAQEKSHLLFIEMQKSAG